jgi:hypothetical protein
MIFVVDGFRSGHGYLLESLQAFSFRARLAGLLKFARTSRNHWSRRVPRLMLRSFALERDLNRHNTTATSPTSQWEFGLLSLWPAYEEGLTIDGGTFASARCKLDLLMSETKIYPDDGAFGGWVLGFARPSGTAARAALLVAAGVNCVIFGVGTRWFGLPELPGFDGSLIHQPSAFAALVVVAVLLAVATLVGTVVAGAVRFEAGLFAAAFALLTISVRCGTMQSVLLESDGKESIYLGLSVELIMLGIFLIALWMVLWRMAHAGGKGKSDVNYVNGITAMITQMVATGIVILILCQSEAKNQVLAGVGIASYIGSVVAYKFTPVRPSIWYWVGPMLAGLVGYILAAMGQDSGLSIGSPAGAFAALARPLPIDYASVGTAGAILGYWMMRKKDIVGA